MRKTPRNSSGDSGAARAGIGRAFALGLSVLVLAIQALGCGSACGTDDDSPPQRFAGGVATAGVYESSPWPVGLLPFPGGKQYQLEHHLGFTPASVEIYFGFEPVNSALSPCAGNSCLIRCVDDEVIWIKNDTCAEFFIRVVAAHPSSGRRTLTCNGADASVAAEASDMAPDAGADALVADEATLDATDAMADGAGGDP